MRSRTLAVAVLLMLSTASGFACGEVADTSSDSPAATQDAAAQQAAREAHAQARRDRLAAQRQARREARLAQIRADRRAARRAQLRAKRAAARAAAEAARAEAEAQASDCDPNYSGACLDPSAYDYDCAGGSGDGPEYTGPVQVVGDDPYDLDRDGDGYACE